MLSVAGEGEGGKRRRAECHLHRGKERDQRTERSNVYDEE